MRYVSAEVPRVLTGIGLERLMVVILRTPAKTPLHPRDITAALRASFIYFQVIAGPRSDIHRAGSQHDYDSYIYNAHNMRDR